VIVGVGGGVMSEVPLHHPPLPKRDHQPSGPDQFVILAES